MNRDDTIAALVAACLPSERVILGLLDAIGPTDSRGIADALDCPLSVASASLDRLVRRGLVVLVWRRDRRRPWFDISAQLGGYAAANAETLDSGL
jgi:hypothetical protein